MVCVKWAYGKFNVVKYRGWKTMNKNKIIALSNYSFEAITNFYKTHKDEDISSSFSNWNAKDVIGHILFWVDFSCRKLDSIKTNKPFVDISNFDKINEETYENNKNISVTTLFKKTEDVFSQYKKIIKLYNDNELLSKTFPTGFSFELWRYMVMDVYIHPIMHLLHFNLKTENYDEFINEINNCSNNFFEYSDNDINVFNFNEFFETGIERINQFKKLRDESKNLDNKIIGNIIKVNMQEK
jgi:hypothetical protein